MTGVPEKTPAKSSADFICADGERRMKRRVCGCVRPFRTAGSVPLAVSIRAPNARSCAATGSIGRVRSDASPSNRARRSAPVQAPSSIRAVEPEFMQSIVSAASCSVPPQIRAEVPLRSTCAPMAIMARAVARTSLPGFRFRSSIGSGLCAPRMRARCEIDLSPGTATVPRSGPAENVGFVLCITAERNLGKEGVEPSWVFTRPLLRRLRLPFRHFPAQNYGRFARRVSSACACVKVPATAVV